MTDARSILNAPPAVLDGPQLLHELVQWHQHSTSCALDFSSNGRRRRYTYRELRSCVSSLQSRIRKTAINGPSLSQQTVVLLLPQSPALYVSQLAVLQSGCAFCPLSLDAPRERIKFVVGDVSARLVITTPDLKDVVSWPDGPVVMLVEEFLDSEQQQPQPVVPRSRHHASPSDLAYVMYTSGSTGTPKGVPVSHRAVTQSLLGHQKHIPRFARFLQFASPSFDVSIFETFFTLFRGATLVGVNRAQLLNDLPGAITALEIDAAELTPTVISSLMPKRSDVPGLKLLLGVGEKLTWPVVKEYGGSATQANLLYGIYGPTETAIHCMIYPKMAVDTEPGNIGIPFDTVATFIALPSTSAEDVADLKFLPVGELGELLLGGPQLAQGYLNRKEQEEAAFVHFEGKRFYRTGDKARQLQDGTIEIMGRIGAGQVKLRGQRIELGEIEGVIYKHPGLRTVVASVLNGVLVVFAHVAEADVTSENVLETCAQWLPKFMIPSEIVLRQRFPYLPSGKVDKRKLESEYQAERAGSENESLASGTEIERAVRSVLHEILGSLSATTRLAAAGLDSLTAIKVASKLRILGFNIDTITVLQAVTFQSLLDVCEDSKRASPTKRDKKAAVKVEVEALPHGHAKNVELTTRCTPVQSAMLAETAINEQAYRNWVELSLPGIADVEDIFSALHELAACNPILRTGFAEAEDRPGYAQIIWRDLEEAQIELVESFNPHRDRYKDVSLHRPVQFQIQHDESGAKILMHIHHALYDAWSLELLLDDLNTILLKKSPPERPPFTDVVFSFQDGTLKADDWASKDYWRDHLALLDIVSVPNFNTDKPPSPSLAVAQRQTSIPTSDIELAARGLSSSPQALFQAAYALVLSSYLGSSDICFGTVFSGRTLPVPGIEEIVGPCLATLPIRVDISTSSHLRGLVQELNSTTRKHLEYSTLPLTEIKAASGISPRQMLFDTLLIWQQTLHKHNHTREHVLLVDAADNLEFRLTLEIIPSLGNIEMKATYQQALFPEAQIRYLLLQVEQLVRLIVKDETTSLERAFSYLEDNVLSIENRNPKTELRTGTLSSSVEDVAARDPDRIAVEFATAIDESITADRITYSRLNCYSNQIGHYLLDHDNVLPDELVCICMEKSIDLYASILATAKLGAGYLPIAPDVPWERLQHILREAKIKVVIARSSSSALFKSLNFVNVIYIDDVKLSSLAISNIPARSTSDMLAYCVFTSGSTGTPKGVLVTQGNLLSNLDVLEDMYPTSTSSRFLQSCSQAFDVSVFEIFFAWRVGGTLCSAAKDVLFQDIEHAIRLFDITHLSLTPTVAALVDRNNVPKVEFLVTAGEAITPKVFNAWADRGLWVGYGPSETTNICTIRPRISKKQTINNIGSPLRNTSAFVLAPGPDFALLPRGGLGEFCFGGSQVYRGYMDLSQEFGKIINHPQFGRLYRSGDFGRLMPDGSLAFAGRKDDQVKIRGQRVELGEITSVVLQAKEVRDCVTMVLNSEEDDRSQRLVCFWTISGEERTDTLRPRSMPDPKTFERLYKSLDAALPPYMIPSALIPLSYMPSTTQGKIDQRLLIKHFRGLAVSYLDECSQVRKSNSDHTWTELESAIAKSVAEVARVSVQEVGPDTSFFNLGIDSISAIRLSNSLAKSTGRRVNISDVLKSSSVVRLAERLGSEAEHTGSELNRAVPLEDTDFDIDKDLFDSTLDQFKKAGRAVQRIFPCTPLQEAMLSAAESSTEKLYDNSVTFDVQADIPKLESCWQEMVKRHDILRTCFVSTNLQRYPFIQVVLRDHDLKFGRIMSLADRKPQGVLEPPYALDMLQSCGKTKLVISMHHALYDGPTLAILYEEVEILYRRKSLPDPVPLAPFFKYVASLDVAEADEFWQSKLRNCPFPKLDVNKREPALKIGNVSTRVQQFKIVSPLSWIEANTKRHSTSLLAVCQTIWSSLLAALFQETDICFGNVVNGRSVPISNIDRLVAPCFNTIPARLQNIHTLSYLEAFRKLQFLAADSLPFQHTPLRRIQTKISPDGSRLFDTLFLLQQPAQDLDAEIWTIESDSGTMDFPIVCEVKPMQSADTLEVFLHTHTDAISEQNSISLLKAFDEKLNAALQNPRRQILAPNLKETILAKLERRETVMFQKVPKESSQGGMSAEELNLRDVIKDFTNVPATNIGRDVSFFRLGLDSITTVQVAARLRKQGYSVLASDIMQNPSISQLNALLSLGKSVASQELKYDFGAFDKEHRDIVSTKLGVSAEEIEAVLPCTSIQQGMLARNLHSGGFEYLNSIWFEVPAHVSTSGLKEAWTAVCKRNEMLRTSFASTEDPKHPFVMVVRTMTAAALPWHETSDVESNQTNVEEVFKNPWCLNLFEENGSTILKLTAHHALYDAKTLEMIFSDVAKIYASQSPSPRPPVTSLLGAILQGSELDHDEKKSFWEKEENKVIVNRFPDLTPLRVASATSAVREVKSQSQFSELDALCRSRGVTIQAATQATWARLLSFYVGETSTTFGTTLSGRSIQEEADQIAFPSIVTLPVRCEITGTNGDLLNRTMSSNASLHKHQFTPLTSIQKWAGFPEGKIFDTLFAFQKFSSGEHEVDMPWKVVREEASADYAVSLEVQPTSEDAVTLRLTFRQDVMPIEHAELLLKQYDALLLDTLQNPQSPCDVAPQATTELLSITAADEPVLPAPVTLLHQFVELGARDFPDRKALEFATNLEPGNFRSTTWNYYQLDREANKIANLLLKRDVEPGQMIAICFDKCAEASFTIVGILKAGCSYVALDPNAPADRLQFIVEDSGAKLVVTAGKPGQNLKGMLGCDMINLDSANVLAHGSSEKPKLARDITPEDISYCLYTSGTTGTPKGCLITHDNAVQFMLAFSRLFAGHWDTASKYLQFASFHFDVSVMEQFWSWSVGICVASAPRDLIFEDITAAIQQLGITHIDLTPSLARLIHPDQVPTLCKGAFVTGGEQLKQEILDVWGEKGVIYNGYGPTEVTIGCTMYPRVPKNGKPSNIGPAYVNVGSFVLKPGTELPVLRGGIGELCVSGKLVGKGYLNRPDLTAERFPTLKIFNERVYRTGDHVRILHDGSFIFLGRADDQVKLRGQRLELSEINEVIKKGIDSIQEAVTLVLKHITQQKEQLVTFFVASSNSEKDGLLIPSIKEVCKSRLPGYMVPIHFIPIKVLPLNANNKADSKQLAAMYNALRVEDLQQLSQVGQGHNSWTESERRVVEAVARTLHVDEESLTGGTTIFELGIDSISIIGFSRALQNAGLGNAKLSVVKHNTSIKSLVRALLDGDSTEQGREHAYVAASQSIAAFSQKHLVAVCQDLGVESAEVENISPCTPVQEGMIYRFLEAEGALYFNQFEFKLSGGVEVDRLKAAWGRAFKNLEVMRMRFVVTNDGFAQVVLRNEDKLPHFEPLDYDRMDKLEALKSPCSIWFSGNTLKLQAFHGLYDGNSLAMLLRCVIGEFKSRSTVDYGPSFTSVLPYGPLAQVPHAKEFWALHFKDWVSSPVPSHPGLETSADIVATSTVTSLPGFETLQKQLSVTPQALVQAAWLSVLQTVTQSANLTIGIVTSGRAIDFEGADRVIGPLFNTVPFHATIEPGTSAGALISKCHDFNMQMQDFQHSALKDIQKWSGARPGQQLFDTLFVFQRPSVHEVEFGEGVWSQVGGHAAADYPLSFEATLNPDSSKLSMTFVAQGRTMGQEGADGLLRQVEKALDEMLKSSAENIISRTEGQNIGPGPQSSTDVAAQPSENRSGPFTWTEEAKTIRSEIAMLANVSENVVQEYSSVFELGLDSIDIIKLASRLKKRGIEVSVSVVVKSQTLAKISSNISTKHKIHKNSSEKTLLDMSKGLTTYLKSEGKLPDDLEAVLPATPLQQSMVNEMINSGYTRYFNVDGLRLKEETDMKKLREAFESVIERSPILRAMFVAVEDPKLAVSYAQIIRSPKQALECVSPETLSLGHGKSFEGFMEDFKVQSAKLAVENQQLLQVRFVTAGEQKYMAIAVSHALYDGTSLRAIHEDIQRAYTGKLTARPDFMPFLEEVFQSTTDDAKKFWRATLSNLPPAHFPKRLVPQVEDRITVSLLEKRSNVSLKAIEALCRSSRITLQTIGQTCWALVLSQLMGQLDIVFGSVLSCRDSEEASEVMFPLMNTVAVRSVVHGTLSEMLKYMQEMSDTTRQYAHFPLGTAQAYALASRQDSGSEKDTTLFDTLFIYQGRRPTAEAGTLYESVYGASDVEFPVCVEMEVFDDESISWKTACKSSARSEAETEALLEALDMVLQRIVDAPEAQAIVSESDGVSVCGLPKFALKCEHKRVEKTKMDLGGGEWTATELTIRQALHTLSDAPEDSIRKDTTIFHVGLDSISIIKLVALLKAKGIRLTISDIMEHQTVNAMARAARGSSTAADTEFNFDVEKVLAESLSGLNLSTTTSELEREIGEVDCIMPATAGQQYMLRHWQLLQGPTRFYHTFVYTLHGPVNKPSLENAWRTLLERHDILRTGFIEVESRLLQVVFKDPPNEVIYQIQDQPAKTRKAQSELRLPPVNMIVEDADKSEVTVKLALHHALYDGISLGILIDELQSLYRGAKPRSSSRHFKDFVAQSLSASASSTTKEKWTSYLRNAASPLVPLTRPPRSHPRIEVFQPAAPVKPLKQVAQAAGVSINAMFLAALSKLYAPCIHGEASAPSVTFGIYLANRAPFDTDLSGLAAPTLNFLPLCVRAPAERTLLDVARSVQRDVHVIGGRDMVSASLDEIYTWTGQRVDVFVNILNPLETPTSGDQGGQEEEWKQVRGFLRRRAEVVVKREGVEDEEEENEQVKRMEPSGEGAYLPTIDIELRYQDETVAMGVFAPESMLAVPAAERLIEEFVAFWT